MLLARNHWKILIGSEIILRYNAEKFRGKYCLKEIVHKFGLKFVPAFLREDCAHSWEAVCFSLSFLVVQKIILWLLLVITEKYIFVNQNCQDFALFLHLRVLLVIKLLFFCEFNIYFMFTVIILCNIFYIIFSLFKYSCEF